MTDSPRGRQGIGVYRSGAGVRFLCSTPTNSGRVTDQGFAMTSAHLDRQATATGDAYRALLAVSEAIVAHHDLAVPRVVARVVAGSPDPATLLDRRSPDGAARETFGRPQWPGRETGPQPGPQPAGLLHQVVRSDYLALFLHAAARSAPRAAPAPSGRRFPRGASRLSPSSSPSAPSATRYRSLPCEEAHRRQLRRHGPCFRWVQVNAGKGVSDAANHGPRQAGGPDLPAREGGTAMYELSVYPITPYWPSRN
jgi:hypothetical protein